MLRVDGAGAKKIHFFWGSREGRNFLKFLGLFFQGGVGVLRGVVLEQAIGAAKATNVLISPRELRNTQQYVIE